jgi:pimeloyl-ACP methyl ester carboxylesterase
MYKHMTTALLSTLALMTTDCVTAQNTSVTSQSMEPIAISQSRPFKIVDAPGFAHRFADVNGIRVHYVTAGTGEPLLLLHGWPFTWYTWAKVIPELAKRYTVIAPDLRGLGDSSRPTAGYDLQNKADDAKALLAHLDFRQAQVVGHDLGASVAYMLARNYPETVKKLVLMEAVIGGLPGAEKFAANPPWWFAFHNVPGLAERVLPGHEAEYLDWFYVNSSYQKRGISSEARDEYLSAYSGSDRLRGGFEHYRAFAENTRQVTTSSKKLMMPTMAIGGGVVGDLLFKQLKENGADVTGRIIPECGHNIPDECPAALLQNLRDFLD